MAPTIHVRRTAEDREGMTPEQEEACVELSRRDRNHFSEYAFEDKEGKSYEQEDFHRKWQAASTEHDNTSIGSARGHGKTEQVTVIGTIWELGKDPESQHRIASEDDDEASKRIGVIDQHIRENRRVRRVFPKLQLSKRSTAHKIWARRKARRKDASIEASGILSGVTGGRCTRLVGDDICGRRNTLTQPRLRPKVKEAWYEDWNNLLEPGGTIDYVYSPWHEDDCSAEIAKKTSYHSVTDYVKVKLDDLGDIVEIYPIWQSRWSEKRLWKKLEDIDTRAFLRAYCGIAYSEKEKLVKPHYIDYEVLPSLESWDGWFRVQGWDPAAPYDTKTTKPDFVACCDLWVNVLTKKMYVADAWQRRSLSLDGQKSRVLALALHRHQELGPTWIGIEETGQSALAVEAALEYPELPIIPMGPAGLSKSARLEKIVPFIQHKLLVFSPHLNPEKFNREHEGDIIGQLLAFPFVENDDMIDALVYAVELARGVMLDPTVNKDALKHWKLDGRAKCL